MEVLIAIIIILVVIFLVMSFSSKKGGNSGGKQKSRAQILKDASQKLAKDPNNPDGLIPLGELYFSERNWEKAYPIYETMMGIATAHREIDPFVASLRQGICALKLEKIDDAVKGLESAYNRMSALGHNQMLLNRVIPPEETIAAIERVTMDDVMETARRVLTSQRAYAVVGRKAEKYLQYMK